MNLETFIAGHLVSVGRTIADGVALDVLEIHVRDASTGRTWIGLHLKLPAGQLGESFEVGAMCWVMIEVTTDSAKLDGSGQKPSEPALRHVSYAALRDAELAKDLVDRIARARQLCHDAPVPDEEHGDSAQGHFLNLRDKVLEALAGQLPVIDQPMPAAKTIVLRPDLALARGVAPPPGALPVAAHAPPPTPG